MFQILPVFEKDIFAFKATGKLTDADYQKFVPELEAEIEKHGPLSVFLELEDFHGWEPKAAWDDFKMGLEHGGDFKKIAIVGDKKWERWMAIIGKAFTGGRIQYFDSQDSQKAWDWLRESDIETEEQKEINSYKNILVAIDFSEHSEITVQRAMQLAEKYNARLTIIHALEHVTRYDRSFEVMVEAEESFETDEVVFENAEKKMKEITEKIDRKNVQTDIIWGRPKSTLLSYAEAQRVDLIVMGSHGHHGLAKLLGSTTNRIINSARCDVLVVRK